jgi:hypothetical protein
MFVQEAVTIVKTQVNPPERIRTLAKLIAGNDSTEFVGQQMLDYVADFRTLREACIYLSRTIGIRKPNRDIKKSFC